jgi:HEPN domain-containing protein/predicted nucleotidyltransferase
MADVGYNGIMATSRNATAGYLQPYRYASPHIPLSAIRRFARRIAERFKPEKIILFGSYAYGRPHHESDVDLLVIMPAHDEIAKANRIRNAFDDEPFLLDLIVRTPRHIERGLKQNNWFLREVIEKGKVLYDGHNGSVPQPRKWLDGFPIPVPGFAISKGTCSMTPETTQWVRYAEEDWEMAQGGAARTPPLRNPTFFHCQQSAEKYLKALMQETGLVVPRTHQLEKLLDALLSHHRMLAPLRRGLRSLTPFAVNFRYPGRRATTRRMQAALRQAERVRRALRARLGLPT